MNMMPRPLDPEVFEDEPYLLSGDEPFVRQNPQYASWWDKDEERSELLVIAYERGVSLRVLSIFIGVSPAAIAGRAYRLGLVHAHATKGPGISRRADGKYMPKD